MCGIIGYLGSGEAVPVLLDGLRRLEYRGYDSAGIAVLGQEGIVRRRAAGKIANLETMLTSKGMTGEAGVGHTRWATHGAPTRRNAHPHMTGRVAVVHNGIIENYRALRDDMRAGGRCFESETDTEVVAHLFDALLQAEGTPAAAMTALMNRLEGMFALAILIEGDDVALAGARRGAPLVVGWGDGGLFLASDAIALAGHTRKVSYLEENDLALVRRGGVEILDTGSRPVERPVVDTELSGAVIGKGNYRHFMEKEIHEQPVAVGETLGRYLDPESRSITIPGAALGPGAVERMTLIACGTAYYAALIGKYWLERLAGLPADADIASEFRYRRAPMVENCLGVFISQSGETADTLAAMRYARGLGRTVLAVTNTETSTAAREADLVLATHAGPEIGVAATKTFTAQVAVLFCLAVATARDRGTIDHHEAVRLAGVLTTLPSTLARVIAMEEEFRHIAWDIAEARHVLYLGRGTSAVVAMEGALKLKEISYIHAEAHAAGEMKHGPIALIDEHVPVIVVAPGDELFDKTMSNVEEARARGGRIILITDETGAANAGPVADRMVVLPAVDSLVTPLVHAIPVQMIAYHAAVRKGTDVDQPRNLAKSVTVE